MQELVRTPQPTDWIRFSRYAPLVHRLQYNIHSKTHKHLDHSVFNEIARTRLQLNILPNLNALYWITGNWKDMEMSIMFMHEQVKNFVVMLPFGGDPGSTEEEAGGDVPYLANIASRMPCLMDLDLRINIQSGLITIPMTTLLSLLTSLQTLTLPPYLLNSQILTTVSRLPNLGDITFEHCSQRPIENVQNVSPTLTEGAFPSLWMLSLIATMHDVQRVLEIRFMSANLTRLNLACPIHRGEDVHVFMKYVADSCQMLKSLALLFESVCQVQTQ